MSDKALTAEDWEFVSIREKFQDMFDEPEKAFVAAVHHGSTLEDSTDKDSDYIVEQTDEHFLVDGDELWILNDGEADAYEDKALDSYIDDCLDIPDNLRFYFDVEKWKDDAKIDGRGHIINSWDGSEWEYEIDGTWYYVYPQG